MMEATLLSVPPAYVAVLRKKGYRSGRILTEFHKAIDRPLAAILTLNTFANTIGAVGIGNEVSQMYGSTYLGVASGVLTLTILIFSEIIPKTLGAVNAKPIAPAAAYIIATMVVLTYPFVLLSRFINRLLAGKRRRRGSREEMIAAAEMSADEGVIHQKESRIIKNLLMLDTISASAIMTPRNEVNAFSGDMTVGEVIEKYKPVRHSRNPIYSGNIDHVVGLLLRYKLMEAVSHDDYDIRLREIAVPMHRVSEDASVGSVLDEFIKRNEHQFLVVDKKGRTAGIVTLEDAVETLLGVEIDDEADYVEDMRQYALDQWRLKKKALLKT